MLRLRSVHSSLAVGDPVTVPELHLPQRVVQSHIVQLDQFRKSGIVLHGNLGSKRNKGRHFVGFGIILRFQRAKKNWWEILINKQF